MTKLSIRNILHVLSALGCVWFFFWIFIYEMGYWNKPLSEALSTSIYNDALLTVSAVALVLLSINRSSRLATLRDRSSISYMLSRAACWYWTTVFLTAFTMLIVLLSNSESADLIIYVRQILGLIFVVWFPGYTIVRAILPRGKLKNTERIALSLGMSLASVALVGLLLSYTPSGVSIVPVTLGLFALTMTCATAAVLRECLFDLKQSKTR